MVTLAVLTGIEYVREGLRHLRSDERGQDALDWVMMTGLLAIAIVAVAGIFYDELILGVGKLGDCLDLDSTTACAVSAF